MIKWTFSVALGLCAVAAQSQTIAADTASVTIVVNGKTYTGVLQGVSPVSAPAGTVSLTASAPSAVASPLPISVPLTTLTASATTSLPPRLTAALPTAPMAAAPVLPAQMLTAAWPLNQPALQYPDETRSLNSSVGDGQFTRKPIAGVFKSVFGPNHIRFDTTMPWVAVDSSQTPDIFATVNINHPEWGSDDGSTCRVMTAGVAASTHWPVKAGVIEAASEPTADHHVLVMDVATSRLYELYSVSIANAGTPSASYSADAGRCWDVSQPSQGMLGQNSADAAGLPILPLLLRYDEANAGAIHHALRFTVNLTRANNNGGVFTLPASHAAGNNWSSMAYMGMRLRLRSDFDAKPYSAMNQTIVEALKTYGIVVADNGITGLLTSDNDSRWNAGDLTMLSQALTLNDFVPVNSGPIVDSTGADAQ